jgi:2-polyprenyl-6-methoxyphenol hydroxylase-like FAD-dependent oxidoreductase
LHSTINPPAFLLSQVGSILTFPADSSAETLQWVAFLETPERERKLWDEYKTSGQAIADLRKQFDSMTGGPIKNMVDSLAPENILLWAPYATPELPTWHTDRVCLLGDAAHAISPSAGQGTAQALEDVGLLARLLSSAAAMSKGYPALFAHYERARRVRLEGIKQMNARTLQSRAPTPSWIRFWLKTWGYKVMLGGLSRIKWMLPSNSWIEYDVTKESIEVA